MRRALAAAVLAVLAVALLWRSAEPQPPLARFRLQGAHTSVADVDHAGALYVAALSPLSVTGAVSQSGPWTIQAAHQGGVWTMAHQSAQVHVVLTGPATKPGSGHLLAEIVGQHLTGAIHVASISNIGSGNAGTGTTAMACHSNTAIHVTGTGFVTAGGSAIGGLRSVAILHLTSSNGGLNQATWRFYICGIALWSNAMLGNSVNPNGSPGAAPLVHRTATIAIVEGSGTDCATNPRAMIGSLGTSSILLANAVHVGATINIVSPFPFISTLTVGNSVCIYHTMKNSQYVTGYISYRAGP